MDENVLSEYSWTTIWGVKKGERKMSGVRVRLPKYMTQSKEACPLTEVDEVGYDVTDELGELLPVTAQPVLGINWWTRLL